MADWKKIKAEYIRTQKSYRELSEKYGVSFSTLQKIGAEEKWTDLRKKSRRKAEEKLVESVAEAEAKKADKIQTVADLLLDKIDEKVKSGEFLIEARDVRALTAALKDLREIKGYKSDLDMQEQMARIEKLRKDAQSDEDSKDIHIVIGKELEDYAE